MKRLLTLLALVLCSCAETFVGEEMARPNNENLPDLTAAFAEEDNTRTYIEDGKYLRWCEDDRLTIFFGNTLNRQYKFNGQTGDNSGTFSLVADGMLGTGNAFDCIYALYPYNAYVRISDEGVISLTLPTTQTYAENSFGVGANTMVAVTENLDDTFLSFKNTCGYLKLKLYNAEGATLKSIEVKGNSGERLAGTATVTINYGEAPTLTMAESATDAITLDCGEGIALGRTAEEATELWVVLPATTFAEGLTITATDAEGKVFKKSTTKEVIIERNAIQPMAILEAKFIAAKPANNEIWYTNGSTTEPTTPYRTNMFGANIVSNTYDAEKECWVIKCDGEVTTIGDLAFYGCSSLTSVTIPDSVTSIGSMVFYECGRLTSITIGDSVTSINPEAFSGCSSLTSVTIPDGVTTIGVAAFDRCYSLTSVTIPDSVTTIRDRAFSSCSSLREFNGKYASEDGRCLIMDGTLISFAPAGLTEYAIPNSVTTIGEYAFAYCSRLTSVTITDSVTTIRYEAFSGCSRLTSVYCKPTTPPAGSSSMFYGNDSGRKIYVPVESVEAYKSATGWSDYADSIVGYDFEKGEVVPEVLKPANNEIWYTNGSTTEATTPYKTNVFGANIVSNTYDAAKECWVIKFDGEVTTIGVYAFRDCSSLTSVTIPDSVTTIGNGAFYECRSLTSITIPDSVTTIGDGAFSDCDSLTSVTIPNSVTTIGRDAFYGCDSLTSVTIPDSVTSIGDYAFCQCRSLTSVTIGNSVTTIGRRAFSGCTGELFVNCNIPSASSSSYGAFYGSKFTSVTIGDGVTTIGNYAFEDCSSLTSVTIGDSVTTIGEDAFYDCDSLTSVTIGNSVTTIGRYAFEYCSSLTRVTIPDSVTEIGYEAFSGCSSLREFNGKYASEDGRCLIMGGTLNSFAPAGLTEYTIPNSVTTIGVSAFYFCNNLTSVTIPDSVTTIGVYAFYHCSSLTSVTIPDSVTTIGGSAFRYCSSLTSVYCKAVTPPAGGSEMFYLNASGHMIYVPAESVEAYKSASYWSDYADAIVGYNF